MCGAREAPAPRDSLNFRRSSLLSKNEFESGTFIIVLHAISSFTYVSVIFTYVSVIFTYVSVIDSYDRRHTVRVIKSAQSSCRVDKGIIMERLKPVTWEG